MTDRYVRQPEATVDELRVTIEALVLDRIARENPGIDLHDVEDDRVRKGQSWTAQTNGAEKVRSENGIP